MEVTFFPRKDYNVEICAHRLGKKMTYTEQTDGLHTELSYTPFMNMAKARNIKVGCFMAYGEKVIDTVRADYVENKLWIDLYSLTPSLRDKTINRLPITQEEWNIAYYNELLPFFREQLNKKPVALSYSYGNDSFKNYVTQLLGARNSNYYYETDYGVGKGTPNTQPYSFSRFCSKAGTTRWYDYARSHDNDFEGSLEIVSAKIDETLQNGGWMNNFTHWHNYWQQGNEEWAEAYLDLLAEKNSNGQIYFAGYGEAVAYLVYRSMITKAVMYSPNAKRDKQLIIRLETDNSVLNVDTDLLQVPISVKFSLQGTPLAGSFIHSSRNLISLGNDTYIVEIPYTGKFPYVVIHKTV
jgi:hypothetical protein